MFASWFDVVRKKPKALLYFLLLFMSAAIMIALVLIWTSSSQTKQASVDHGKIIDCLQAQYSYAFSACGRAPPYDVDSNNYFCFYKDANNRTNAVLITCIYLSDIRYAQNGSLVSIDVPFCGPAMNGVYEELTCPPLPSITPMSTPTLKANSSL